MRKRTFLVTLKSLDARETAIRLMMKHGLAGWQFAFNGAKRRAGVCYFPATTRPGRIELSVHYCERNTAEEVRDTILHEIAHALAYQESGDKGHGTAWKAVCARIGARPVRCTDAKSVVLPAGSWQAVCPTCNFTHHRHRKPKRMEGWYCRACGKEKGKISWVKA